MNNASEPVVELDSGSPDAGSKSMVQVHPMASSPSDTITSEGAMAAREMVRQLFEASLYGRIEEIESLAPKVGPNGLSSVKDGNGRNALHFAAQGAQLETASYLIRNEGINPNLHDEAGKAA